MSFDLTRYNGSVSDFISNPKGSDLVSEADDAIRETREHLVDCLRKISGYPDVDTVCVKVWNNSSRPTGHFNGSDNDDRFLLGYNTDINALEVVSRSGTTVNAVALLAYPVGSYYETSDPNFNPNEAWGGTWVLDTDGRVLVGAGTLSGTSFAVDDTGGEITHALLRNELPIHYHPHRHPHTHEIAGRFI